MLLRRLRLGRPAFGAELGTVAVAAVPGVAWLVGLRVFFSAHPDYAMTDLSLRPQRRILAESLDRPAQFFHVYAPELWRAWWIPVVALAVLVVVLVSTRRWARAVPAVLVAVLVLAVMSTTRAALVRDIFVLPKARLLAGLPYGCGSSWVCHGTRRRPHRRPAGPSATPSANVVAGVGLLALAPPVSAWPVRGRGGQSRAGTATRRAAGLALSRNLATRQPPRWRPGAADGTGLVVYLPTTPRVRCAGWERVRTYPGLGARPGADDESRRTRNSMVLVVVAPGFCGGPAPRDLVPDGRQHDLIGGHETTGRGPTTAGRLSICSPLGGGGGLRARVPPRDGPLTTARCRAGPDGGATSPHAARRAPTPRAGRAATVGSGRGLTAAPPRRLGERDREVPRLGPANR